MGNTTENLQAAFAGESQANRKYLFFAEVAEKGGDPQLGRLFRAAAEAETVHARNHLRVLGDIKADRENLEAAVNGESYEFTTMYPEFIEKAKAEGNSQALRSFDLANKVEKVHHKLFEAALKGLEAGKKAAAKPYYVCQVCGYTAEGEAPDKCPVCGAPKAQFKQID